MLKKTKLCTGLMVACGGVLLSAGSASFAQPAPAPAPQSLERVEITGSNIRRADAETASPVQVITKQEIDQSGKGTVAEYLQTLTADGQGSVPFTYGRGFSGATAAGISLRGLGANATLVLINGRRVTTAVLADDAQRTYRRLEPDPDGSGRADRGPEGRRIGDLRLRRRRRRRQHHPAQELRRHDRQGQLRQSGRRRRQRGSRGAHATASAT